MAYANIGDAKPLPSGGEYKAPWIIINVAINHVIAIFGYLGLWPDSSCEASSSRMADTGVLSDSTPSPSGLFLVPTDP